MLTKILLIATFLLLAWSTFEVTNKNQYVIAQNEKVISMQNEMQKQQAAFFESVEKRLTLINEQSSELLKEHSFEIKEQNTEMSKSMTAVSEKLKKVEGIVAKLKNYTPPKKPAAKKKPSAKPKPKAKPKPAAKPKKENNKQGSSKKPNSPSADKVLATKLQEINDLHKKGAIEAATTELNTFKGLIWKNRKDERVTKKKVLSIISSIDFALKKWKEKEVEYDLSKINEKYKTFFTKTEASK